MNRRPLPFSPQETAVWDYDGWEEIESSSGKPLRGRTIPLHPTASPAPAEEEEGGEEAEETLKRKPGQKRHKRFSILGTEEKDNRPEDEFPVDPEEIEDYEKPEDAASILHDLGEKHRTLLLRAGVTGLSLFLMLLLRADLRIQRDSAFVYSLLSADTAVSDSGVHLPPHCGSLFLAGSAQRSQGF